MTRFWFHGVAFLAFWGGEVIAQQEFQFGDFTYSVNGADVTITDYPKSAN